MYTYSEKRALLPGTKLTTEIIKLVAIQSSFLFFVLLMMELLEISQREYFRVADE